MGEDEWGEPLTLSDTLAARADDPATVAVRRLDWAALLDALDKTASEILCCLVVGADLTTLVSKLKRSRSALQSDKDRLGTLIRECLGPDILARVQERPRWMDNIEAHRQTLACRQNRSSV